MSISRRTLLKASVASVVSSGIGVPMVARAQPAQGVGFESFNYRGRFIRHKNFHAELEPVSASSSLLDRRDATFLFQPGLEYWAGGGTASWQASNPGLEGHFLRHQNFRLMLAKRPTSPGPDQDLFDKDATFIIFEGLAARPGDRSLQTFRPMNFLTRTIRHRDFHLFLDEVSNSSSDLAKADSTFHTTGGFSTV